MAVPSDDPQKKQKDEKKDEEAKDGPSKPNGDAKEGEELVRLAMAIMVNSCESTCSRKRTYNSRASLRCSGND